MVFSCFRSGDRSGTHSLDNPTRTNTIDPIARPPTNGKRFLHRQGSAQSRFSASSTASTASNNSSISRLPPCKRVSDPVIEAMMMPLPTDCRPSRCLRLSNPKTYSNIVDAMKKQKGCRDWRNFDVFHQDDIDMSVSAEAIGRRRAADYARKWRILSESFDDDCSSAPVSASPDGVAPTQRDPSIDQIDMIG